MPEVVGSKVKRMGSHGSGGYPPRSVARRNRSPAEAVYLYALRHQSQSHQQIALCSFNASGEGNRVTVSLRLLPLLPSTCPSLSSLPPSLPAYPHCGGCQLSQQQLVPITRALTERDDWPTTHTQIHKPGALVCPAIHFTRELKTDGIQTLQSKPQWVGVHACTKAEQGCIRTKKCLPGVQKSFTVYVHTSTNFLCQDSRMAVAFSSFQLMSWIS